ncbi:hypothetical protein EJB05_15527, partial [Eragrostis curvula]
MTSRASATSCEAKVADNGDIILPATESAQHIFAVLPRPNSIGLDSRSCSRRHRMKRTDDMHSFKSTVKLLKKTGVFAEKEFPRPRHEWRGFLNRERGNKEAVSDTLVLSGPPFRCCDSHHMESIAAAPDWRGRRPLTRALSGARLECPNPKKRTAMAADDIPIDALVEVLSRLPHLGQRSDGRALRLPTPSSLLPSLLHVS